MDLESAVLDIPRLEDKYLREAKKIVHEKALETAQVQISIKKMEKEVQSLAFYQYKVKDLEEQNSRLRLANDSLQRQCRITLRKVHSSSSTKIGMNTKVDDTQIKTKQRPVSASAVLSSVNIEDSFNKTNSSNNENNLLISEVKALREKNNNLVQHVSSLRHKLAIARAYPLSSASADPSDAAFNRSNKTFNNNKPLDTNNNAENISSHVNTYNSFDNEHDDESYFDSENIKERETERLRRSADLSMDLRKKILVRQTVNQQTDPHTESIRSQKKFPSKIKIINKFLN